MAINEDAEEATGSSSHGSQWQLQSETILVEGGRSERTAGSPMNLPLYPVSNFRSEEGGQVADESVDEGKGSRRYAHTDGTPTWDAFESIAGSLEGGQLRRSSPVWRPSRQYWILSRSRGRILLLRDRDMGTQHLLEDGSAVGTTDDAGIRTVLIPNSASTSAVSSAGLR